MATLLPNWITHSTSSSGQPTERVANKVKDALPEPVKDFIRQSPFIVMATSNREGWRRLPQRRHAGLRQDPG